jgi:hypothetical protein
MRKMIERKNIAKLTPLVPLVHMRAKRAAAAPIFLDGEKAMNGRPPAVLPATKGDRELFNE